jgi:hypothetical protein
MRILQILRAFLQVNAEHLAQDIVPADFLVDAEECGIYRQDSTEDDR